MQRIPHGLRYAERRMGPPHRRFRPSLDALVAQSDPQSAPRCVCLTRNHWRFEEKLAAFVGAMSAIKKTLQSTPPPFLARINKAGKIVGIYDFEKEKEEDG
jgi:hypothetical protein